MKKLTLGTMSRLPRPWRPSSRQQLRPQADVGGALRAQRVLRAVALGRVGQRVEQGVEGLLAFEVDQAQRLAALQGVRPRRARRDHHVEPSAGGIEWSAHWCTFVLRTPVFALGAVRRAHDDPSAEEEQVDAGCLMRVCGECAVR
jgi:hypothetical protein